MNFVYLILSEITMYISFCSCINLVKHIFCFNLDSNVPYQLLHPLLVASIDSVLNVYSHKFLIVAFLQLHMFCLFSVSLWPLKFCACALSALTK